MNQSGRVRVIFDKICGNGRTGDITMSINEKRFVSRATIVLQDDEELHQASINAVQDSALYLMTHDKVSKDVLGVYDQAKKSNLVYLVSKTRRILREVS